MKSLKQITLQMPVNTPDGSTRNLELLLKMVAGGDLRWHIFDLYVVNTNPERIVPEPGLLEVEKRSASATGYILSHRDLETFSRAIPGIIDGIFVGVDQAIAAKDVIRQELPIPKEAKLAIRCFDSTFWYVYSRDESLIECFLAQFPDATRL